MDVSAEESLPKHIGEPDFKLLFFQNPAPMWIYEARTLKFMEVNSAAIRQYGYSREEFLTMTITDIRPPEYREELLQYIRNLQPVLNLSGEWIHFKKNGEPLIVNITSDAIIFRGVPCRLVVVTDLSEQKKAAHQLKKQQELFKTIADNVGDVVWILDLKTRRFTYMTPSVFFLRGYTVDEAMNQPFDEILTRDSLHRIEQSIPTRIEAWQNGNFNALNQTIEVQQFHKDGHIVETEMTTTLLPDESGDVHSIVGISRDISQRKATEKRLQSSEEHYRSTLENMMEGAQIISHDWVYLYVNRAAEAHNRKPRSELLGKTVMEVWADIEKTELYENLKQTMTMGHAKRLETHFVFPDGGIGWFHLSVQPIAEGIFILSQDITEKKIAEQALYESMAFNRAIIHSMPDKLFRTDKAGIIIDYHMPDTSISHHTAENFIGKKINDVILTESIPELENSMRLSFVTKTLQTLRYASFNDQKEQLTYETRINPVNDDECLFVIRDITLEIKAEQAIRQINAELELRVKERTLDLESANEELESFTASVSHDLRAPLRTILGFSQTILDAPSMQVSEEITNYLDRIKNAGIKMESLIADILRLSRIHQSELNKQKFDFTHTTTTIAKTFLQELVHRKIRLNVQPDMVAHGDIPLMQIVITNLLSNAIKFTSKKDEAHIEVCQQTTETGTVFIFSDNGAGMDMRYVHKLFTPFQRLHRQDDFEGTGIGLALVSRIIRKHGGKIWVESKKNHGARFFFTLPSAT